MTDKCTITLTSLHRRIATIKFEWWEYAQYKDASVMMLWINDNYEPTEYNIDGRLAGTTEKGSTTYLITATAAMGFKLRWL